MLLTPSSSPKPLPQFLPPASSPDFDLYTTLTNATFPPPPAGNYCLDYDWIRPAEIALSYPSNWSFSLGRPSPIDPVLFISDSQCRGAGGAGSDLGAVFFFQWNRTIQNFSPPVVFRYSQLVDMKRIPRLPDTCSRFATSLSLTNFTLAVGTACGAAFVIEREEVPNPYVYNNATWSFAAQALRPGGASDAEPGVSDTLVVRAVTTKDDLFLFEDNGRMLVQSDLIMEVAKPIHIFQRQPVSI